MSFFGAPIAHVYFIYQTVLGSLLNIHDANINVMLEIRSRRNTKQMGPYYVFFKPNNESMVLNSLLPKGVFSDYDKVEHNMDNATYCLDYISYIVSGYGLCISSGSIALGLD